MPGPSFEQVPFAAGDTSQTEEARRRFEQLGKKADIGVQRVNLLRQQVDTLIAELDAAEAEIDELQLRRVDYGLGFTYVAAPDLDTVGSLAVKIGNGVQFVSGAVSAKGDSARSVTVTGAGIGVNVGNGLQHSSGTIVPKLQENKALTVSADGLAVDFTGLPFVAASSASFVVFSGSGEPKHTTIVSVRASLFSRTTVFDVPTGYSASTFTQGSFNLIHRNQLFDQFAYAFSGINENAAAINALITNLKTNGLLNP